MRGVRGYVAKRILQYREALVRASTQEETIAAEVGLEAWEEIDRTLDAADGALDEPASSAVDRRPPVLITLTAYPPPSGGSRSSAAPGNAIS
jgi:hypothetical protein